jgi:hypothetical protein
MAASSRWMARVIGTCGVQSSAFRMADTWLLL